MNIKLIIFIIIAIIIFLSVVYSVVVTSIAINLNNQVVVLKREKNLIVQDYKKMKDEYLKKQEIIDKQNDLLLKAKSAKTLKEYLKIWEEIK